MADTETLRLQMGDAEAVTLTVFIPDATETTGDIPANKMTGKSILQKLHETD
jgi:hypothetical protein